MKRHWLNRERLVLYSGAMLVIGLFIGAYWFARSSHGLGLDGSPLGYDFIAFWAAARLAASGNAVGAYDFATIVKAESVAVAGGHPHVPWEYPPSFLLLVLPLALMPYFPAYLAFVTGSFLAYAAVLRKTFNGPGGLLPFLAFPPVFLNFFGGQNGFLTAALLGAALLLLRSRPLWAGALIGVLTIKPHLGLLLPVALLCGRHWRAFGAAALAAIALLALSVGVLGGETLEAFLAKLPVVAGWVAADQLPLAKMPTFFSFGRLLGMSSQGAYVLSGSVAFAAAVAVAWVWLRCEVFALRAAALVAGSVLSSPYLFDYDLAWLALAFAWFASYALQRGWLAWEREVLVAAWLIPILMQPLHWLLHVQVAPLVLLALFLMILRRVRWELSTGTGDAVQSTLL